MEARFGLKSAISKWAADTMLTACKQGTTNFKFLGTLIGIQLNSQISQNLLVTISALVRDFTNKSMLRLEECKSITKINSSVRSHFHLFLCTLPYCKNHEFLKGCRKWQADHQRDSTALQSLCSPS